MESKFRPLEANVLDYDLAWAQYMGYGVAVSSKCAHVTQLGPRYR